MNSAVRENIHIPFADNMAHLQAALAVVDVRVRWAVVRARASGLNPQDEFRGLYIADEHVDQLLDYEIGQHVWLAHNGNGHQAYWSEMIAQAWQEWQAQMEASRSAGIPLRLAQLCRSFDLSNMEIEALLLVLAGELDPRYAQIYAYLQDDVTRKRPSIDLILNLLTDSFKEKLQLRHLFGVNGRLQQHHLLKTDHLNEGQAWGQQNVRLYPHVTAYLLEDDQLDKQLRGFSQLHPAGQPPPPQRLSPRFLEQLQWQEENAHLLPPVFAFLGGYGLGKREAAQQLACWHDQSLLEVDMAVLSQREDYLEAVMPRVWRDGRLHQATLYLTHWDVVLHDGRPPRRIFSDLLAYPHTVIIAGKNQWQPTNHLQRRPIFTIQFNAPDFGERYRIWRSHLGEEVGLDLTAVANQFRFTPGQIEDTIATAHDLAQWHGRSLNDADLLAASRAHSNQNLATLASKIQPRYTWDDIVLPQDTMNQLYEMVNMVRHRPTVYGRWGFNRKLALGKGLSALFAGDSGTGKTMAADIMAGALGLDLYKVDLSTLVSKYIGETEKNLDRIFTEAATSNAILFFDEADAIFGKRSEVKDSHDRYANIEISYLLQRMEAYDGVVILATNLRANLDEAFTRRLHFAIEFPFPEAADRERIWQVNIPAETPVAADVDFQMLAERYPLAGGNIRNIILSAAFLAAEADDTVRMAHLLHAARREYQKIGRLIDEKLFREPDLSPPDVNGGI